MMHVERKRCVGALVLLLCICSSEIGLALDEANPPASGERLTTGDLKNADVVRTFTPQEFMAASDKWTSEQCRKGTLRATTDGTRIIVDGVDFAIEDFGSELLRRYKVKRFYCVDIAGPGFDVKRVNKLLREVKGTDIASINWHPDERK